MELTQEYFDRQLGNLATKGDLQQLASKADLETLREDFRAMKTDVAEIKQTLTELNKRDKEDSDAFAQTIVKHDERLTKLESETKQFKLKQA